MFKFLSRQPKKEAPAATPMPAPAPIAQPAQPEQVDYYVKSKPCAQNALDIFKGEWHSKLPGKYEGLVSGPFDTFRAPSVAWGIPELGGVKGQDVLDLGPLEGGNSYMLVQQGAASVTAVEANTRAFLKCLIVKELYKLTPVSFHCGDCIAFLREAPRRYDLVVANGILYHMANPVELISLLSKVTDRVLMCTHYYDAKVLAGNPCFPGSTEAEFEGFKHTLNRYEYQTARYRKDFSGGINPYSHWLTRKDILGALEHFGFKNIRVNFEDPTYIHGPGITLAASKT